MEPEDDTQIADGRSNRASSLNFIFIHAALSAQHDYLRGILSPREHRKPQKTPTKIQLSTGYTLSPLIYSQIHVTIFSPTAKLLHTPI